MSSATELANKRVNGPVLTSRFAVILDNSAEGGRRKKAGEGKSDLKRGKEKKERKENRPKISDL